MGHGISRHGLWLLLALAACTHDTSALRGDGGSDSGGSDSGRVDSGRADADGDASTADTGPVDTGVVDSGVADTSAVDTGAVDTGVVDTGVVDSSVIDTGVADAGCSAVLYQSTELTPDDDRGLFMSTSDLHGWWFHVDTPFVPTEMGAGVRVMDADATLHLALVPVTASGSFPSDTTPSGAVLSGDATAAANGGMPQDATVATAAAATVPAGWYALTVRLTRSSGSVRRAGTATASGMGFRMSGGSRTMPSSVRRVFIRGCE